MLEFFDRNDNRHTEMAATSKIRIFFGSDEAAYSIETLKHPVNSIGIYFTDKQSEAWICKECIDSTLCEVII